MTVLLTILALAQLGLQLWLARAVDGLATEVRNAAAEAQLHALESQTIRDMFSAARRYGSDVVQGREV